MNELRRAGYLEHARTAAHRRRVARSERAVADLAGAGVVVAWSGGKDSTCCLQLAADAWPTGMALISVGTSGPSDLIRSWRSRAPQLDIVVRSVLRDDAADREALAERLQGLGAAGQVLGLRRAESSYRSRVALGIRAGRYRSAACWGGLTVWCPILDWTIHDVWAYLLARQAPYLAVYDDDPAARSPSPRGAY